MSRYASNYGGAGGNHNAATAANSMLHTIAGKESQYHEGLQQNQAMVCGMADRVLSLERQLPGLLEGVVDEEEIKQIFQKYKDTLKECAERNVQRHRQVQNFVSGVRHVQQQQQQQQGHNASNEASAEDSNTIVDYQDLIRSSMQEQQQQNAAQQLEIQQEEMYRDVLKALDEKVPAASGNNDDDDEVIIESTQQGGASLKCPITGMLLDEPVKSKVCHHVYSRAGIQQHIQTRGRGTGRCQCPVPGCTNSNLSMSQLDKDMHTSMLVKREKRRLGREQEKLSSQANDLEDSDEEEE